MTTNRFFKKNNNNIFFAIVTAVCICVVLLFMMTRVYIREEQECYENLHIQTKQFKDDITMQITSDSEMLSLVANLAGELYKANSDFHLVFDSYEPTGFVSNVGILQKDNTFITKKGVLTFEGAISFEEEVKKGEYVSGRVKDITNNTSEIIRLAKPITVDGEVVGILYGSINLDALSARYKEEATELNAQLYVYEAGNGNFIIDTIQDELENVKILSDRKYDKGYSYEELVTEEKGYSVFQSKVWNEKLYMHYSTLEFADWKIMLARRATHVFEKARYIAMIMLMAFLFLGFILVLYFMYLLKRENKNRNITAEGSQIRKLLLDINEENGNVQDALERITVLSKSRSAFFADTEKEEHHYGTSAFAAKALTGDDRTYFICEILRYAAELRIERKKNVDVISVKANHKLHSLNPKFYDFLVKHEIYEIIFAAVTDKNNHIGVLGVINPKHNHDSRILLSDVAVCFSIAIYNKKYLNKTEIAATTDSLTGLLNRVTYKKDIKVFDEEKNENFACIYVDVNELHLRNNRYGHAAGDEMLIYIANTLKEVFYGHHIYRMGGDEFLVFTEKVDIEGIRELMEQVKDRLLPMDYHVALGMSYRQQNNDTEELVREAEIRMYEAKAQYYQNKETKSVSVSDIGEYKIIKTGIGEIDVLLTAMKYRYNGIYRVSLNTDEAHRILMPAYLGYNEMEASFRKIFTKYVEENVNPDFHRSLLSFLNYDALKSQLMEGIIPSITYKKSNSEDVKLSVYSFAKNGAEVDHTLWIFEKM